MFIGVNCITSTLAYVFSGFFPVIDLRITGWDVLAFYLLYSFINYWIHRLKHDPRFWFIHEMHHAPSFMHTEIAMWRHPFETFINLLILIIICNLLELNYFVAAAGLLVEGCLELFHHSNIRTPSKLRWLHYIVQLPEMHLIHHQRGLHHYNYSPLSMWDWLFNTAKVPENWEFGSKKIGLEVFRNNKKMFLWR